MTCVAVAQLHAGAIGDAMETIERAFIFNPEDAAWRPETLRIRGELQLKQEDPKLAEADFLDSIAMARSMSAKAWELRTTMSLARLMVSQGVTERLARCSPKSAAGSPKASTPPI
jgi:hypothetical protein